MAPPAPAYAIPSDAPVRRWTQEVTSTITRSRAKDAYVVDDIALPLDNPWRRNVRLSDIQFLRDGTGVAVTIDGDVWTIRGLDDPGGTGGPGDNVRWRRFASGLHEPMTLAIRDEQIYVFDRNGIWGLRDTNGDGEADVHELFSNAFAQTADTREFPSTRGSRRAESSSSPRAARRPLPRQAQRQRAAHLGRRPTSHRPRLRIPAAEHRRQHTHRPRDGERPAGKLCSEHALAHRARPAVLRLPE